MIFGANSHDGKVLQVGCLKGVTDAKCQETANKIVGGRK